MDGWMDLDQVSTLPRPSVSLSQAAQLKLKNAMLKAKLLAVKPKTDVDISDEIAGAARLAASEVSRKKKADDAARIAAENAVMRQRIENVQPKTDDDVGDEAAGAARAAFAERSRKKREDAQASHASLRTVLPVLY